SSTGGASTIEPTTTGSASNKPATTEIPDLWFELPPGFTEFDLEEDSEERMLRMADAVDLLFSGATPQQKFSFVVSGEYALQTMISAGAEHASASLLRTSDGKLSQATLCVIVERPDIGPESQDRMNTAKRTAVQWREQHPDADVGLIMLPYGPSAVCIGDRSLQLPGALFGLEKPVHSTVRQAQFCVPLKTGPGSALFVFMTEDIEHWGEYLGVLSAIMQSVSADEPNEESRAVVAGTSDTGNTGSEHER
ncbi:hypothetical protein, partial [Streptomyces sp. NPDC048845]|uniref:hypothetical protein n=1 Tax=Streptomyces sp. NPDC048845 TaxID=3155390 RepID=UPI003415E4C7